MFRAISTPYLIFAACNPDASPPYTAVATDAHLIAEHARTLSEVFFLDSGRHNMDDIVGGIVAATPAYTQVNLITTAEARPDFLDTRAHRIIPDTLPKSLRGDPQFWTQDAFQVITRADATRSILLPAGEYFAPEAVAALGALGYDRKTSALRWEGGNVVTDVVNGESVLYIGFTIYEGQSSRAENPGVPVESVQKTLAAEFEVDEVIPIPYVTGNLFHLDQIFMITGPGEVIVHDVQTDHMAPIVANYIREEGNYFFQVFIETSEPPTPPETQSDAYLADLPRMQSYAEQHAQKMRRRLDEVADLFARRGYSVHRLSVDLRLLWDRMSLVNGVPYIDQQTGQKTVLLPEYTHHNRADFTDMDTAKSLFESLGYAVRFVPVLTASGSGGPHCLSNVGW